MRVSSSWLRRVIAFGLVVMMAVPSAEVAVASPQKGVSGEQAQSVPSAPPQPQNPSSQTLKGELETSGSDVTPPDSRSPIQTQSAAQGEQPANSQSASEQPQETTQKPVGSAAAPFERTTGVAASRPAGAVIAPGKQRRARSIVIRVSIVVGAAVAIGTVVALSHGSPSRPN
jgi:cytoskeletal protein RodZ